jgi:hypothetical protein
VDVFETLIPDHAQGALIEGESEMGLHGAVRDVSHDLCCRRGLGLSWFSTGNLDPGNQ